MKNLLYVIVLALFSCVENENKDKNLPLKEVKIEKQDSIIKNNSVLEENIKINEILVNELCEKIALEKKNIEQKLLETSPDEANKLYQDFYKNVKTILTELNNIEVKTLETYYDETPNSKLNIKNLFHIIRKYALYLKEVGEGFVEIETKPDYFYKIFKNFTTKDYEVYLNQKAIENETIYAQDAGLVISFKDLGERIIFWENFLNEYPDSTLKNEVFEDYKYYQDNFLFGMDNTPTYEVDYNINENKIKYIYPENITEFNNFKKNYPNSPLVNLINIFVNNHKNTGIDKIFNLINKEQDKIKF